MKRYCWVMTALMVTCIASVALADTIYFKSGMRLDVPNTIVRDGKVYYEMYGVQTSALMSDIKKIEKGELPQASETEVIVIDGDELEKKRRAEAATKRAAQKAEAEKKKKAKVHITAPTWAESLTGPQNNAVRSAKQYLSIQGFSRSGLIHQLSSDYGDGYNIADATIAVDSLNIDWNEQAVRSAKQYLSIQGFSCKGLINQLSSSAGDGYTQSQANYGARQAGACQ